MPTYQGELLAAAVLFLVLFFAVALLNVRAAADEVKELEERVKEVSHDA